jgi:beta-lactamase class A
VKLGMKLAALSVVGLLTLNGVATDPAAAAPGAAVAVPLTPVGKQLAWLLAIKHLPIPVGEITAHFDASFLAQASPAQLNAVLGSVTSSGAPDLDSLSMVTASSLSAFVSFGASRFLVELSVDPTGLIDGLIFKPDDVTPTTWSGIDRELSALAPDVGFLAAMVSGNGTCTAVHAVDATTPRPLGSMFKLFILGALANAIHQHRISWEQHLTLTAALKAGGSGTLQNVADGTRLSVQQVAVKMISISDNTAADMLLQLVGRAAIESQVRKWSAHPSLNIPFLSAKELFALKYDDFPTLANRYLALGPTQRAAFLSSTVDHVAVASEQLVATPRDVKSLEWFASPDDLCRAFAGLQTLQTESGLGPLGTVLSTNNGGIQLSTATWPRIWFKGGSEPGVLTLGYLARDAKGHTYVVIAMNENPAKPLSTASTAQLLALVAGGFDLLH